MPRSIRGAALRPLILIAAVGLLSASAARAQVHYGVPQYGPSWEITAFGGYYIASDLETTEGSPAPGADIGFKNSFMYGGRLTFNPNPMLGLEFAYTRSGSDLELKRSVPGYAPHDLGRMDLNGYDLDLVFSQHSFVETKMAGFFALGVGWTVTDPKIQAKPGTSVASNSLFAWNIGLGAKIALSKRLLARLEGRWRITDTNITTGTNTYCDYWGYCYNYNSQWYNSGELTAGLAYKIRGK